METGKKNRNYKVVIDLFFCIMFVIFIFKEAIKPEYNLIILNISIGLLTFVAIFYTFVLKREITQRRKDVLAKKWKDKYPEFSEHLEKINKEKEKDHPDYLVLRDTSYELSTLLEDISRLAEEINITKFLNRCVISYILAIIFVVIDYGAKFEIHSRTGPVTGTWVGFMAMWVGIYYLARLIMAEIIISEHTA